MSVALKRFLPLFDRILVKKFVADTKTASGIIIPEKSQEKMLKAIVVETGEGYRNDEGKVVELKTKVGDEVLLPEFGGTKVVLQEVEHYVFREHDIIGKFVSK